MIRLWVHGETMCKLLSFDFVVLGNKKDTDCVAAQLVA